MANENEIDQDTTALRAEIAALRAENAQLRKQLRVYERLVPDPIVEVDRALNVVSFTRVYDGFTENTITRNPLGLVAPDQREEVVARLRQVFAEGQQAITSFSVRREDDGRLLDFTIRAVPADDTPHPRSLYLLVQDHSEQRALAEQWATQRTYFRAIFEHAADMILLAGDDMQYIEVNPAAAATLGYTVEEMSALAVTDVFPPMERAVALELWQNFIAEGTQHGEVQVRRKDGTVIDVDYSAVANILPGVHLSVIRDISQRKRLEADLTRSEVQYRAIFEHAPIGMGISDSTGKPVAWNAAMVQVSGFSEAELHALTHVSALYVSPAERNRLLKLVKADNFVQREKVQMRRGDGSTYPARITIRPIDLPEGRHLLAMMEDITEEVDARTQEAFLAGIMANIQDAVVVTDQAHRVRFWNAGAENLLGVAAGQILGRRFEEFFSFRLGAPDGRQQVRNALAESGHWDGEVVIVPPDGRSVWTWTAVSAMTDVKGAPAGRISVIYDLTEQRALEAENRRQAQILGGVMEAIIVTDLAFNITDWNASAESMYGWRADEVVGRTTAEILAAQYDDYDAVLADFRAKGRWQGEVAQRHKDGSALWVLASVSYVYDDTNTPVAVVAVNRDITRRHTAENALLSAQADLRRLMRRLEQTEVAQRKELARNLHDDLGATLTTLRLDIDWLEFHLADGASPDVAAKLQRMAEMATASIRITQNVTSELRPTLLDDLGLAEALDYLAETWSTAAGVAVEVHLDETLAPEPEVAMDLYRIVQEALTNVARHAAATKVAVELLEEDGQIVLLVADDGRGIDAGEQTDPDALGIIGMRERAEAWGGRLSLTGTRGRGTTVTVRIPIEVPSREGKS